ncbi:MAG: L,D-transpeptidase family protein [Olsenella sp.]|jgi:uncharacterized protein YjdB|nr:L,D-transpeptidase family protein [Olsenella sp.]
MRTRIQGMLAALTSVAMCAALIPTPALAEALNATPNVNATTEQGTTTSGTDQSTSEQGVSGTSSSTSSDTMGQESSTGTDTSSSSQDSGSSSEQTPSTSGQDDASTSDATSADSQSSTSTDEQTQEPELAYAAHVQNIGWQANVSAGGVAGTTGRGLRVEALRLSLGNMTDGSSISVSAHVQNVGWQDWSSSADSENGYAQAGTTGKGLRVEAVKIKLDGPVASRYDVWYRVHVQDKGWMGWTKDGSMAGTTGMGKRVEAIQVTLVEKGADAPGSTSGSSETGTEQQAAVSYRAHVQNIGWQGWFSDGKTAGTTGMGLAVEALDVRLSGVEGAIQVNSHVQDLGWQGYRQTSDSNVSGTTGRSKRVEAIRAKLTGEAAQTHDLWYRVHVQNLGWLGWAKAGDDSSEGAIAGTTGCGLRVEAVQFKLTEKNAAAPGDTNRPYVSAPTVTYQAHVQNIGWQNWVGSGAVAGTTGRGLRVEALRVKASGVGQTGEVQVSAHVEGIGWQGWKSQGAVAGTVGQGRRVEAIRVRLTGSMAQTCDVWYRVHVQKLGWMGWTRNGGYAGTTGCAARVEAVQIVVRPRGSAAPGATWRSYTTDKGLFMADSDMYYRAQRYGSRTNWLLMVNYGACRVGVFNRSASGWNLYDYIVCSDGQYSTPTVHGVFTVGAKGYSFSGGDHTCYYYTQFHGNYLFHSVLYHRGTFGILDGRLGMHISQGCVRLNINKAKWIYDNIPTGTTVVVYN